MFGLNKYTAKPPVLSDRVVGVCVRVCGCVCVVGGLQRKREAEKKGEER